MLRNDIVRTGLMLLFLVSLKTMSFGQGRVVVNEFMSWSGCNTTSEFIELLNFGPGPMDISCFKVTNGQYAVTIPTNTILKPGEYFVLSGGNVLTAGCGNTDSAVVVDLNWTTCNCTDKPVPTTGDGFLENGGGANEKIVLMDASGNVLDAVSRSNPTASDVITTSSVSGACTPTTFDLDGMAISYERIGIATGVDNSYSRRVDGDCGWVKTTEISAGAPNKTGSTSSANYSFTTLNASECSGSTGSISINVSASDLASLFPMTYLLAFDANANNVF
ncbi:MAG TPA: lamin tail domain-containing protein, partial [Flavitalea sp.]|nr:lamin tail domain-containing protein [Flavitalea sp.]